MRRACRAAGAEALRRRLVDLGRAVVGLGGADLQLHPLVEEEVPVVPELLGQEGLELVDVVEADGVAFLEGRDGGAGVLGLLGRGALGPTGPQRAQGTQGHLLNGLSLT